MSDDKSIAKRTEAEVDGLMDLLRRRPWVFSLAVLVVISVLLPSGISIYQKFVAIPKLEQQIRALEVEKEQALADRDKAQVQLAPFLAAANQRFPDVAETERLDLLIERFDKLEKQLTTNLAELNKEVAEQRDFVLSAEHQQFLIRSINELVEAEKNSGLENEPLEFELFPQQSLDAGELLKFMRAIFKNAGRETNMAMVHNSKIPTNIRAVIFKIGDPKKPPTLLAPVQQIFNKMGVKSGILIDDRIKDQSLTISAQRPVYVVP